MINTLIMGSGRSGTSMLAGILHQSGYFLGENLYKPHESNPRGFFECLAINSINEAILNKGKKPGFMASLQAKLFTYYTPRFPGPMQHWLISLPPENLDNLNACGMENEIQLAVQHKGFAYKDPRFCYTLNVWEPFLKKESLFICVFREPSKTIASIRRECKTRPYLEKFHVTAKQAFGVWNNMYLGVLHWNDMYQGRFLFLHYNQILNPDIYDRLENFLETRMERGFPDPKLNRSPVIGEMPPKTERIYTRLCHLAGYDPS